MSWKVFIAMIFVFAAGDWLFPGSDVYILFGAIGIILVMATVAGVGQMFGYWP